MRVYIIKRLLWMIPTLFIITVASYGMMRLAPGDPVKATFLGGDSSGGEGGAGVRRENESTAAREFRRRFYLDQPWYVGYWRWLAGDAERGRGGVVRGDFGDSIVVSLGTPVWDVIAEKLPATIKLNLWSFAIIYIVSISFGLYSAVFKDNAADRFLSLVFFILYSLPAFWIGILMIIMVSDLNAHYPGLNWPIGGLSQTPGPNETYWESLWRTATHYVLPVACLSYGGFASLSRFTRSAVLETIRQDYVRAARAKGLSEWAVIMRHVFRNSLIPLVTLAAGLLPGMLGGSMIIEYLFNIPGMGTLMLQALASRDYPVLMTVMGLSAFLVLVGIFLSDTLYALADPRITFE